MSKKETKKTTSSPEVNPELVEFKKEVEELSPVEKAIENEPVPKGPSGKWESQRLHDRQPVKGIFRFHEVPGGTLNFSYLKYKGDPIESFKLKDGETYTIPLGVAKHLRNSGWYPVHAHEVDERGVPTKRLGQKVKRFTFEPLDFIADPEMNTSQSDKDIVTVTNLR